MARAVISDPKRRTAFEPLYDLDPQTGASVEIFYADRALAYVLRHARRRLVLLELPERFPAARATDWPLRDQLRRVPR